MTDTPALVTKQQDAVCKHGTALDVHCCNCHSGFLFDVNACVCITEATPDFVELLKQAREQVESSPLYKRFIDGTPLENDIAVWMADFAAKQLREFADALSLGVARPTRNVARLRENTSLRQPNWDGFGAAPITDAALDAAEKLVAGFDAVPIVDGGVQLEAHISGWDIEIEIGSDGQPQAALIGKSGEEIMTTYAEWPVSPEPKRVR